MPQENRRINPETGKPYPTQKERLDEITSKIEQGIKDVFESENYKNYLSVMSRFHNYSTNNCMLIYMQNPNATKVASFKAWKEKFGRHVTEGEKGINIIAPAPYKKRIDVQKIDPDTKEPVFDKDGNPIMCQKEVILPAFKAVKVFDISQTQGKPLPQLAQTLNGEVENYEHMKEAIRKSAPVPIKFEKLRDGLDGFFSPKEQAITVREGMSEPQTLCAMVHETAHSILHNPETSDEKKTQRKEEVEAESVAYAVCKYFGIDTDENSFGYLAAWSKDKDVKELRESLDIINETSSVLISSIEKNYKEMLVEKTAEIENSVFESATYKIGDKAYLQIQKLDDGINYDFSFFRQDNYKLMDGGFTDFEVGDKLASATMSEMVNQIVVDFNMKTDDITLAGEDIVEAIEKANTVENPVVEKGPRFIEEDKIKPPCPELTQETLEKFGYTYDGMYPITKEVAIDLMENYCDVYLIHDDNTEAAANDVQEIMMHEGCFGVEKETWNRIAYRFEAQRDLDTKEKAFMETNKDSFAIYQLKSISRNDEIVFMNSQYLDSKGISIDKGNYSFRYAGELHDKDKTTEEILENIYERFNFSKPEDYHSRSVSVSDILAVRRNGELSFNYVDSVGFKEVPGFIKEENYLKNAEQSVEDDFGMIDGIINNGEKEKTPKKKKAELQEDKSGKRESVLAKLEKNKEKVKSQPRKESIAKEFELT